jgi:hypothetical protein
MAHPCPGTPQESLLDACHQPRSREELKTDLREVRQLPADSGFTGEITATLNSRGNVGGEFAQSLVGDRLAGWSMALRKLRSVGEARGALG